MIWASNDDDDDDEMIKYQLMMIIEMKKMTLSFIEYNEIDTVIKDKNNVEVHIYRLWVYLQ